VTRIKPIELWQDGRFCVERWKLRAINIERYACGRMRLVGSVIDRAAIKTLLLRDSTLHLLALDRLVSEGVSGGQ
tara:strand:+ start:383 stop:607 length:225 start_codon:yes stop_codon:yes gene_type:complete